MMTPWFGLAPRQSIHVTIRYLAITTMQRRWFQDIHRFDVLSSAPSKSCDVLQNVSVETTTASSPCYAIPLTPDEIRHHFGYPLTMIQTEDTDTTTRWLQLCHHLSTLHKAAAGQTARLQKTPKATSHWLSLIYLVNQRVQLRRIKQRCQIRQQTSLLAFCHVRVQCQTRSLTENTAHGDTYRRRNCRSGPASTFITHSA